MREDNSNGSDGSNRFAGDDRSVKGDDGPFTPAPYAPQSPVNPYMQYAYMPNVKPPLGAPWYGIGFGDAIVRFFRKTFVYSGRASRGEYWWAVLFMVIVEIVVGFAAYSIASAFGVRDAAIDSPSSLSGAFSAGFSAGWNGEESPETPLSDIMTLAMIAAQLVCFLPQLSLFIRRLHDVNLRGWWYLAPLGVMFGGLIAGAVGFFLVAGSDDEAISIMGLAASVMGILGAFLLSNLISVVMMIMPSNPRGVRFDKPVLRGYGAPDRTVPAAGADPAHNPVNNPTHNGDGDARWR